MSTTIPALSDVTDILDTDLVMITHSNGQSYKIAGSELNKRNQVVIATGTTITGTPLKTGNVVRVYFTAALSAANGSTALVLKYNNVNYTVKVPKNGALQNYVAFDIGGGTYKYLQAYTTLELIYDGTNFVILGNPVVLSDTDYTIYADGLIIDNDIRPITNNFKVPTSMGISKNYTRRSVAMLSLNESNVSYKITFSPGAFHISNVTIWFESNNNYYSEYECPILNQSNNFTPVRFYNSQATNEQYRFNFTKTTDENNNVVMTFNLLTTWSAVYLIYNSRSMAEIKPIRI